MDRAAAAQRPHRGRRGPDARRNSLAWPEAATAPAGPDPGRHRTLRLAGGVALAPRCAACSLGGDARGRTPPPHIDGGQKIQRRDAVTPGAVFEYPATLQ